MDKRNDSIVDFVSNLESAERILRNRRYFAEADAVKISRDTLIPLALEVYEKGKEKEINNDKGD